MVSLLLVARLPASIRSWSVRFFLLKFLLVKTTLINVQVLEILTLISKRLTCSFKRLAPFGVFNLNLPVIERGRTIHMFYRVVSLVSLSKSNVSKPSGISSIMVLDHLNL